MAPPSSLGLLPFEQAGISLQHKVGWDRPVPIAGCGCVIEGSCLLTAGCHAPAHSGDWIIPSGVRVPPRKTPAGTGGYRRSDRRLR
jgi:hypothetical protein